MYHGSSHFGKAYQDELLREAGVFDEQGIEIRRPIRSRQPGLLRRLLGGIFRTGAQKPASPVITQQHHSIFWHLTHRTHAHHRGP